MEDVVVAESRGKLLCIKYDGKRYVPIGGAYLRYPYPFRILEDDDTVDEYIYMDFTVKPEYGITMLQSDKRPKYFRRIS